MPDSYDLSDKVAIIIGGSKGMGLACAEQFAASGAKVLITSRNAEELGEIVASLNQRFGKGETIAAAQAGDMSRKEDLRGIVDKTLATFGKITSLVLSPTIRPNAMCPNCGAGVTRPATAHASASVPSLTACCADRKLSPCACMLFFAAS